jgi:hypothetical protein
MLRKIRLDTEGLAVESFDTTSPLLRNREGTVLGQAYTGGDSTCFQRICTCASDNGTCDVSCHGGCGSDTCDCGGGGTTQNTNFVTCATGFQRVCECLQ